MNKEFLHDLIHLRLFSVPPKLRIVLLLLLMTFPLISQAQVKITGTVVDENQNGMPGVNILVKGTSNGTVTDANGFYSLDLSNSEEATLVFSSIGYNTLEETVRGRNAIDVSLIPDITSLSEVVVIGYGEVKKSNVTGSIVSVKSEELRRVPSTNVMESLQGSIPGMDITRTSGAAGGGISVQLRGNRSLTASGEPLFIVDGVQYPSIQDLSPNDIQSMEVLKDAASTAIYGSRGANGVILITTKKGASGKTKISFNAYGGPSSINGYPKVQNGEEYTNQRREAKRAVGQWSSPADDATIFSAAELANIQSGQYTDWQNLLLQNGSQSDYQIGLSSGTDKTNIYVSVDHFNENGLFRMDRLSRNSFRVNVDHRISKVFKIGTQNQFTYYDQDVRRDPLNTANKLSPLDNAFEANGTLVELVNNNKTVNPLLDERGNNFTNNITTSRLFTSLYLEVKPLEDLTFRSVLGITSNSVRDGLFASPLTILRNNTPALTTYTNTISLSLNLENTLTYKKTIDDHTFTVTAIQSLLQNKTETHSSSGQNQLLPSQGFFGLENANSGAVNSARYVENALLSYTGRIMYDYKEKYLFSVTGRSDGASQLSPGNKWSFFPSASAAWRIIEEGFMKDVNFVSDLKLRASYGVAGNASIDPYSTQNVLARMPFAFDERLAVGYPISTNLGNDALGWEVSRTINFGLDFGLFQNRVTGSLDVFNTNTDDLLLSRLLPSTSGFTRTVQNVGKTEVKGIELGLSGLLIEKNDFSWKVGASWFATREKIVSLATGSNDVANGWFIGQPTRAWYDYQKLGIWQTEEAATAATYGQLPGQIKVKDQDGNGIISATGAQDDRVILGTPRPSWIGNLTNDIKYKNFDVSIQLFARWGQMIQYDFANIYDPTANENSIKHNYWTPENPSNDYPRPNSNTSASATRYLSTILYEDGSFVKLRGVTIGFNFPKTWLEKTPLSSARFYINGRNLFTMSKIENYDPERGGAQQTPLSRLVVVGVDIQF
jgi:TonB-linked SusC/RagA family outer membrane protein